MRAGTEVEVQILHPNTFRKKYEIEVAQFTFTPTTVPPEFSSILGLSPVTELLTGYTLKNTQKVRELQTSKGALYLANPTRSKEIQKAFADVQDATNAFYKEIGRQRYLAVRYYEARNIFNLIAGGRDNISIRRDVAIQMQSFFGVMAAGDPEVYQNTPPPPIKPGTQLFPPSTPIPPIVIIDREPPQKPPIGVAQFYLNRPLYDQFAHINFNRPGDFNPDELARLQAVAAQMDAPAANAIALVTLFHQDLHQKMNRLEALAALGEGDPTHWRRRS
ncbi:MAG: hypothetical protein QM758_02640 [Armatimonas sp.]